MKVITWNIRKATIKSPLWKILNSYDADIILLQEVIQIPQEFRLEYHIIFKKAINKTGKPQNFGTAIFSKLPIKNEMELLTNNPWVNSELNFFNGNLIAVQLRLPSNRLINVISVYSPAWPVDPIRYIDIDVSDIKLKLNKKVWATDILTSYLKYVVKSNDESWIVGGDFNDSETFDYMWSGGPSGSLESILRLEQLGLKECLRFFNQKLTPTFKNLKGGKIIHQIDHVYVDENLLKKMTTCLTPENDLIFKNNLSDHLPIIVEFDDF